MISAATTHGRRGRRPPVDEHAHQVAAAREHHQRDQRERDAEREHDLADHERPRRVDADRDHDERRAASSRRAGRQIGICRWMNPCITTWPASVPTAEVESPEPSSESAKSVLDAPPSSGSSVLCASSSEAMSSSPLS